jgi:hypothetical protein
MRALDRIGIKLFSDDLLAHSQIRLNTGAIAWRILPSNSGLALVLRTLRFAMPGRGSEFHQSA